MSVVSETISVFNWTDFGFELLPIVLLAGVIMVGIKSLKSLRRST
ncbi:hypothetical protein ACI2JA_08880 [Alkalihalobacillus sp. NPDC078783]